MSKRLSGQDVDLLLLIREEAIYALRIRNALVFTETKIQRPLAPTVEVNQAELERRREMYIRPASVSERNESGDEILARSRTRSHQRFSCLTPRSLDVESESSPFMNPSINKRMTVEDSDALFSTTSGSGDSRIGFTYADLVATREKKKITPVRALRRLANLWRINPKLNKDEMLAQLISHYSRRFPEEVLEYEARRSTTRPGRIRRRRR